MTQKVHGAAYPGVWVERKVAFVKLTFNKNIKALVEADLTLLGTATPVLSADAGTIADSSFGVVESALVQALKNLETRATVLAISTYNATTFSVDVMLGNAEGWFAPASNGIILPAGQAVTAAQAVVTTAGAAPTNAPAGAVVSVLDTAVTFQLQYSRFADLPVGTGGADGTLVEGPGSTSGAYPMNSPTGTPGWYPVTV